mgnify:CR=1 FL=1|jgi:CheY-like chemotaxis protein
MKKLNCILLIDDNPPTNYFNKRLINKLGMAEEVFAVENGRLGLDFLTNQGEYASNGTKYPKPALIILDINMPVMDGWEFLEAYQQLSPEQKGEILIVMLSTSPNPDDLRKAQAIPAISEFRQKPLSAEMLTNILETHFPG